MVKYLVKDRRLGMENYVFTQADPRHDGYKGEVIEGVTLDYNMNEIHFWQEGQSRPEPQIGADPSNSKHYKVFKSPAELQAAGFVLVHTNRPFVAYSWSEYRKQYYPLPEEFAKSMTQDEWFDYLEEADFAAKIRKKRNQLENPQPGGTLPQIAEWVAKRHMAADGGIQQVWFLSNGAPEDEIRLLEVSERYIGESNTITPFDVGLDVNGAKYLLRVADVTNDQLAQVKANPETTLPKGWQLNNATVWGRRGQLQ
jgi:hypothetical protein